MNQPAELFDTAAARRIDAQATALLGGDGYVLMQRAGQAAWQCALQQWPHVRRIVVVCGPGNNGGDGYVLARLARQSGREVRVLHLPDDAPRTPLAQRACTDYLAVGGRVELSHECLGNAELIVDALFGIGLSRAPEATAAALVEAINTANLPVLALDVPSGVDAESGAVPGVAVRADCTLQLIVAHCGLHTGAALEHVGQCLLAELQVPADAFAGVVPATLRWDDSELPRLLPPRRVNTHKGESGDVLCIGGNHGSGGAVMLCAEAALRSGAGLVSVVTRALHVPPLLARCPEAMVHAADETFDLSSLLARADVIALGPGLGQDDWARRLWAAALGSNKPLVVDADALNLLAAQPRLLPQAVLTPHPGEAARLLGTATASIQRDRFAAAQELAARFSATVVLKGAGSVVAAPGATPRVIAAGNPGMAVGGMGDLLTGVIAALQAQGLPAFDAASAGALLHGLAGDAAAASDGQRGLLPRDLLLHLRALSNPE